MPVVINQVLIAVKPREEVPSLVLLLWAEAPRDEIVSQANDSTCLAISKASVGPIRIVGPADGSRAAFDRAARPLYGKIVSDERESPTLASVRGALLPRRISGASRVRDAERLVGDVA